MSKQGTTCRVALVALSLSLSLVSVGCVQLAANLVHAWNGGVAPAEFDGLKEKKVAVVAVTDAGVCTDANAILLARFVRGLLESNVKKIRVVSHDDVDRWLETSNAWTERDFAKLGKGVDAQAVVVVEMTDLTLKEGPTLHRGKSNLSVTVYDVSKDGKIAFRRSYPQFAYPEMAGMSNTDVDDTKFRRIYLARAAEKAAKHFYGQAMGSEVALDATALSY